MSMNQAPEAASPTFEQLMILVSEVVSKATVRDQDPQQSLLSKAEELREGYFRDTEASGIKFPPAILSEVRQALQVLKDAPEQLAAQTDKPRIHR